MQVPLRTLLVVVVAILCQAAAASPIAARQAAKAETISFGDLSVSLDAPQPQVLRDLTARFDLVSAGDTYNIFPRGQAGRADAIGSVRFAQAKLIWASREWPIQRDTAYQASRSFYFAVADLARTGSCQGLIALSGGEGPTGDSKTVQVSCGRKHVQLESSRSVAMGEIAFIIEILE